MLKFQKINFISNDYLSNGNNGWSSISCAFRKISNPKGAKCYEWLDKHMKENTVDESWSGFLHNPITYPQEYPIKYSGKVMPISRLIECEYFKKSLESCKSIFVFTRQVRDFIKKNTGFDNVFALKHPSGLCGIKSSWLACNNVLHVGQQMRKYHSFADLNTKFAKLLIKPSNCPSDLVEMHNYKSKYQDDIVYLEQKGLAEYIDLMCNSVVFLDLYDVAACNTILECISLSVPLLVNKLDGCIEYLGEEYPFYYEDLSEAEAKLSDLNLIEQTNKYLLNMEKKDLSINFFIESLLKC
jgi:hypothetical protein